VKLHYILTFYKPKEEVPKRRGLISYSNITALLLLLSTILCSVPTKMHAILQYKRILPNKVY